MPDMNTTTSWNKNEWTHAIFDFAVHFPGLVWSAAKCTAQALLS